MAQNMKNIDFHTFFFTVTHNNSLYSSTELKLICDFLGPFLTRSIGYFVQTCFILYLMHRRCDELMVYRCVCVSFCVSVRSQLENASSRICLNDFCDTWTQWSAGGGQKGCSGIWGQRAIWDHCSNMLKTLLHLCDSVDLMKLGWRDPWPEVLSGCSGIFDRRSSWGHLGSLLKVKF